ncbi:hypothetical protein B4135_0249 [Caldibacillus debilis]|uniref:DUF2975 domain-containing protein n=2 Tax=Caldibacillus debilis TaxID=301148 RepID=A0A150M9A7_9BACI|nr:hypothetical protein B4135_0249 [Caldibacillus debilis]
MLAKEAAESNSESAYVLNGFLTVMYLSAIPFFFALYQAFKLLNYIDRNEAFSELSVQALKKIKYCAIAISILYVPGLPFFYIAAELEDAPGIVLIGLGIIFASTIIAVFAALLQKLLKAAIDIKSENDLTI